MAQTLIKLLVSPLVVLLVNLLSGDVSYQDLYQPIAAGLLIGLVGAITEHFLLKEKTPWISIWGNSIIDFTTALAVVYYSQYFFAGSRITFFGAVITALILGIIEHIQHIVLLKRALRTEER